jgi:hypothetical protein
MTIRTVSRGPGRVFRECSRSDDDEPQVHHRDEQRDHRRIVPAMRPRCRSKCPSRLAVQLALKPQTAKAVHEGFQFRGRVAKVPKTIPSAHSASAALRRRSLVKASAPILSVPVEYWTAFFACLYASPGPTPYTSMLSDGVFALPARRLRVAHRIAATIWPTVNQTVCSFQLGGARTTSAKALAP